MAPTAGDGGAPDPPAHVENNALLPDPAAAAVATATPPAAAAAGPDPAATKKDEGGEGGNGKGDDEAQVSVRELFREADGKDRLLLFVGTLFATMHGVAFPCFAILFGRTLSAYTAQGTNTTDTGVPEDMDAALEKVETQALYMFALAGGVLLAAGTHSYCFTLAAERMCQRIRRKYFEVLLRQGMPFYDARDATELAANFSNALPKMEAALGINWAALVQSSAQCTVGLIVGIASAWKVGLTMIACVPFLAIGAGGGARAVRSREVRWLLSFQPPSRSPHLTVSPPTARVLFVIPVPCRVLMVLASPGWMPGS